MEGDDDGSRFGWNRLEALSRFIEREFVLIDADEHAVFSQAFRDRKTMARKSQRRVDENLSASRIEELQRLRLQNRLMSILLCHRAHA